MLKHSFDARIEQTALNTFLRKLNAAHGEGSYPRVVIFDDGSGHFEYDAALAEDLHVLNFKSISELNAIITAPDRYIYSPSKETE